MRAAMLMLMLAALAGAETSRPSRAEVAAMEKAMNQRLARLGLENPVEVLGPARGIYVDGFGAVFTAEVNLLPGAGLSPFRPQVSREEVARLRERKIQRLALIRAVMQELLQAAAQSLDRLPEREQVVLAVLVWSYPWEDATGLPRLIQMQAQKAALLEATLGRRTGAGLAQVVQVREE